MNRTKTLSKILHLLMIIAQIKNRAAVVCQKDFVYHRHTNTCMLLVSERISYADADRHCTYTYQGHLVHIFDPETNEFVKELLNELTCLEALIGLNDRKIKGNFWWGEEMKIGNFSCWDESRKDDNRMATAVVITKTVWKKYEHDAKACFVCQVPAATSVPEVECPPAAEGSRNISVLCVTRMSDTSTFTGSNLSNAKHSMHCNVSHCTQHPGVKGRVMINSTHVDTVMLIDVVMRSHGGVWLCSNTFSLGSATSNKSCQLNIYATPQKPECRWDSNMTHIVINCVTSKVYPTAICVWDMTANSSKPQDKLLENETSTHVNYTYGELMYYRSSCKASIAPQEKGHYMIKVTMSAHLPAALSSEISSKISITLDAPQCPSDFRSQKQNKHAITLAWSAGHNGGLKQTFRLLKLDDPATNPLDDNMIAEIVESADLNYTFTYKTIKTFIVSIDVFNSVGKRACPHVNVTISTQVDRSAHSDSIKPIYVGIVIGIGIFIAILTSAVVLKKQGTLNALPCFSTPTSLEATDEDGYLRVTDVVYSSVQVTATSDIRQAGGNRHGMQTNHIDGVSVIPALNETSANIYDLIDEENVRHLPRVGSQQSNFNDTLENTKN